MPITHRYDIPAGTFRSLVESGVIVLQDNSNILEITDNISSDKLFNKLEELGESVSDIESQIDSLIEDDLFSTSMFLRDHSGAIMISDVVSGAVIGTVDAQTAISNTDFVDYLERTLSSLPPPWSDIGWIDFLGSNTIVSYWNQWQELLSKKHLRIPIESRVFAMESFNRVIDTRIKELIPPTPIVKVVTITEPAVPRNGVDENGEPGDLPPLPPTHERHAS